MKYNPTNTGLAEKLSMYKGLTEVQKHFLRDELRKDHTRSSSRLRRIAKKRAIVQQIKWLANDVLTVMSLVGCIGVVLLIFIILSYQG